MSMTQEGAVLQLIDIEAHTVVSLAKIKCVEYSIFRAMHLILTQAIEKNEIDNRDKVYQGYMRLHRQLVKKVN